MMVLRGMTWAAQLIVAIFFIAGFVSFYTEIWNQAFTNPQRPRRQRIYLRITLIILSMGLASVLHFAGYISGSSAMMFHNIGLFILVFALLDANINMGEYLVRCIALLIVWAMHHVNDFMSGRFALSVTVVVLMLLIIWKNRHYIENRFSLRLLVSTIIAIDFWFTLPYHSASMQMTTSVSIEAILMFILMKLSTGRQQSLWAHNRQIAHMASYDKLTNIKNFTAYQKEIFHIFGVARTRRQPLVIAILDIDHFKLVNDQYGHLAGNQILTQVSEMLSNTLTQYSPSYEFYRTGGEEFALVFPDTTAQEAFQVITNCWRAVRNTPITYKQDEIRVSVSVGVTEMIEADQLPDDIYQRADESLYASKRNGRDAVTIDGKTQQFKNEFKNSTYAYFVQGIFDLNSDEKRRRANELILRRYDQEAQQWVNPGEDHIDTETRINLMRAAMINSRNKFVVTSLSVASFLSETVANALAQFLQDADGPKELYVELKQVPEKTVFISMANFYHENGIKIILSQIGENRHFESVDAVIESVDGIKLAIYDETDRHEITDQIRKDVQFWGKLAKRESMAFIVDGVFSENMLSWLRSQEVVTFVEGDYLDHMVLPLLKY